MHPTYTHAFNSEENSVFLVTCMLLFCSTYQNSVDMLDDKSTSKETQYKCHFIRLQFQQYFKLLKANREIRKTREKCAVGE